MACGQSASSSRGASPRAIIRPTSSRTLDEALSVYLDEPAGSGVDIPLPQENLRGRDTFAVELTPEIAFGLVLRHYRMAHKLSQNDMARKLGMQHIYSYQRLERRPNPTLGLIKKIKDALPDFPLERVLF